MSSSEPDFPPLLTGFGIDAGEDPFLAACRGAAAGTYGAGDFLWSRAEDRVAVALVLEPEVERGRAREMLFVAMVACADAVGVSAPPEFSFTWQWPATLRANGATVGRVRYGEAEGENGSDIPDWIVVGLEFTLTDLEERDLEPGETPDRTTFAEEGAGDFEAVTAISSLSRHWLTWIHRWDTDGFAPVHEAWLFRADGYQEKVTLEFADGRLEGTFLGLDEVGNLLLKPLEAEGDGVRVLQLADYLAGGSNAWER